jgi:hypothetical protein
MPSIKRYIVSAVTVFSLVLLLCGHEAVYGEDAMDVTVDVIPADRDDTLPSCIATLMTTIGRPDWSVPHVEGVLGHAFHFEMKEGGGPVMHDHIDWGSALGYLPKFGQARKYGANKNQKDIDLPPSSGRPATLSAEALNRGFRHLSGSQCPSR